MEPENQKKYTIISIGIIILLAFGVWYMFAGRNDVSDLRKRAEPVRAELQEAGREQSEQSKDLAGAKSAVENSQRENSEVTDRERSNEELARENSEILRRVRERGGTENQN